MRYYGPEAEYCLDGMATFGEVTPDLIFAARMMGLDIENFIENSSYEQMSLNDFVENNALEWFSNATKFEKEYCVIRGIFDIHHQIKDQLNSIAHEYVHIQNVLSGQSNLEMNFNDEKRKKILEKYPEYIHNNVLSKDIMKIPEIKKHYPQKIKSFMKRVNLIMKDFNKEEFIENSCKFHEKIKKDAELQRQHFEEMMARYSGDQNIYLEDEENRNNQNNNNQRPIAKFGVNKVRKDKKMMKKAKKVLFRGVRTFESLVGDKRMRSFLSGDTIEIKGNLYNYHAKKSLDVFQHSIDPNYRSVPYKLSIHDKETGEFLSKGCLYFENTPVIDQLLALVLYVKDKEDEIEMLKTINLFGFSYDKLMGTKLLEINSSPRNFLTRVNIEDLIVDENEINRLQHQYLQAEFTVREISTEILGIPKKMLNFLVQPEGDFEEFIEKNNTLKLTF